MEHILIIDDSQQICSLLADYILPELGYQPIVTNTGKQGLNRLRQMTPDLILLDLQLPDISGLDLLRLIAQEGHDVPVILMTAHGSEHVAVEAFRLGARNYLIKPFSESDAKVAIEQALRERRLSREKEQLTRTLQQRLQELTVLSTIGKSVSSMLEHDELLVRIVEASVYITRAEEGFLLLRDEQADELYLRAAKNVGAARGQSLRMPIDDTLAGQVVRTGKPIKMDRASVGNALKVKTGFLVRSLLQVPLFVGNTVIGVLSVDNQQSERVFTDNDQYLLSALADYAAIAIENARLYEQVKRSEQRYRDLFANAYDLIFTLDTNLRITRINNAGAVLTGYREEELRARPLRSLCAPDSWKGAERSLQALLGGRTVPPFEMVIQRSDGTSAILEVSARPIVGERRVSSIHCIARDLTERRRLEGQLMQSEKLSALGQLVAGVAHELNNPLTSISGYTQLLFREKDLSEQVRDDLSHIHRQAERAARIVQNLLVFAREHKAERRLVNLNTVVRDTLTLRAYQLRVDNITVAIELDTDLPMTVADPFQLQQVFLNLINNAHQAMTERGVPGTLTLRSGVLPTDGAIGKGNSFVRVSVGDSGVGIPQSDLKRIFDPFYTTKPVGQGTGLGLSICFGIVQEHGGRIWAESERGAGTIVHVDLPLLEEPTTTQLPVLAAEVAPQPQPQADILVVDDEEPVALLLQRVLTDSGHRVTVCHNGTDALALVATRPFDIILSDVKMPGMNGFELYQQLRDRDTAQAARLIFLTGDTMSPATQARLEQYGNAYLAKPFDIEQLETLIHSMLNRGDGERLR